MNDIMMPDRIEAAAALEKAVGGSKIVDIKEPEGCMSIRVPAFFEEAGITKTEKVMKPLKNSIMNDDAIRELREILPALVRFTAKKKKEADANREYGDTNRTVKQQTFWSREASKYKRIWESFCELTNTDPKMAENKED